MCATFARQRDTDFAFETCALIEMGADVDARTHPGDQIFLFNCLDVYHKSPDSGERRYKLKTEMRRVGPSLKDLGAGDWTSHPGEKSNQTMRST